MWLSNHDSESLRVASYQAHAVCLTPLRSGAAASDQHPAEACRDHRDCPSLSTSVGAIAVSFLLLLLLVIILCFIPLAVLDCGAAIQCRRCPSLALLVGILVLLPPRRLLIAVSQPAHAHALAASDCYGREATLTVATLALQQNPKAMAKKLCTAAHWAAAQMLQLRAGCTR